MAEDYMGNWISYDLIKQFWASVQTLNRGSAVEGKVGRCDFF